MAQTYSINELDWGVKLVKANLAWNLSSGYGVKVAVLDTGCYAKHSKLAGKIYKGKDFSNSKTGWDDVSNHGTAVAGIVTSIATQCKLLIGKVHAGKGLAVSWLVDGINWAIDEGADVINLSVSLARNPFDSVQKAIQKAISKNIIIVCAAGNDGPKENTVCYPAAYPESIAVGLIAENRVYPKPPIIKRTYMVPDFCSRGPEIDIMAPGMIIRVLTIDGGISYFSGTSFASPAVSGAAALNVHVCRKKKIQPSQQYFKKLLQLTAVDVPNVKNVLDCSALVQALNAVKNT